MFSEANILSSLGVRCKIPWIYPLLAQGISDPRMLGRIAAQVREEELNDNEWYMLNARG